VDLAIRRELFTLKPGEPELAASHCASHCLIGTISRVARLQPLAVNCPLSISASLAWRARCHMAIAIKARQATQARENKSPVSVSAAYQQGETDELLSAAYGAGSLPGIAQRAQANPRTITPADMLALQRTIGNRAAMKLVQPSVRPAGTGVVQRYSIIRPQDYTTGVTFQTQDARKRPLSPRQLRDRKLEAEGSMFQSQELNETRGEQDRLTGGKNYTYNLVWQEKFTRQPPLKVSEHGQLAVEETTAQPKVFYSDAGIVESSRKRLADIGSRITLEANGSRRVNAPQDPQHMDTNTNTNVLVQVRPVKGENARESEPLMPVHECNSVAFNIVGGSDVVIGSGPTQESLGDFDFSTTGTRMVETIARTERTDTTTDFAQKYQNQPISPQIRERFKKAIANEVITDEILRILSHPDTPKHAIEHIYGLMKKAKKGSQPDSKQVIHYLEMQRTIPLQKTARNKLANDPTLSQRLGINKDAAPEVGESFSIVGSSSDISLTNRQGIHEQLLDVDSLTTQQDENTAVKALKKIKFKGVKLSGLQKSLFTNYVDKTDIPFQEHHAAVVARDGGDSITFENYNRVVEIKNKMSRLWDKIALDFNTFNKGIDQDIQIARKDKTLGPLDKMFQIRTSKLSQLNKLADQLVNVQGEAWVQVHKNYGKLSELWHFNMYGSEVGQSFHEKWSGAHTNPLTVRTTAKATTTEIEEFKTRFSGKVRERITGKNDPNETQPFNDLLHRIESLMDQQKTMVGLSQVYQQGLDELAQLQD
jgi:hypothetical protein